MVSAFSGIGNPQAFEKMLQTQFQLKSHRAFPDHYEYKWSDLESLQAAKPSWLLTTEKDAVKLRELGVQEQNILVVQLKLNFDSEMEKLYGAMARLPH